MESGPAERLSRCPGESGPQLYPVESAGMVHRLSTHLPPRAGPDIGAARGTWGFSYEAISRELGDV